VSKNSPESQAKGQPCGDAAKSAKNIHEQLPLISEKKKTLKCQWQHQLFFSPHPTNSAESARSVAADMLCAGTTGAASGTTAACSSG
jgi:hypothetical protein